MTVTVRYFASLADRAGTRAETIDVAPGLDVAGLWRRLTEIHPRLADVSPPPMAACDLARAEASRRLDGVTEVAFLPPFSGG